MEVVGCALLNSNNQNSSPLESQIYNPIKSPQRTTQLYWFRNRRSNQEVWAGDYYNIKVEDRIVLGDRQATKFGDDILTILNSF